MPVVLLPATRDRPALPQQVATAQPIGTGKVEQTTGKQVQPPTTRGSGVMAQAARRDGEQPQDDGWSVSWDNMKKQAIRVSLANRLKVEATDQIFAPEGAKPFDPALACWPDGYEALVPNLICADIPIKPETGPREKIVSAKGRPQNKTGWSGGLGVCSLGMRAATMAAQKI